ncbi:MAG TPA: hypothetical protein VNO76_03765 [Thermoplasmata archaeon]|nr:hypothetical protein [Thermoplasmata archaeon]
MPVRTRTAVLFAIALILVLLLMSLSAVAWNPVLRSRAGSLEAFAPMTALAVQRPAREDRISQALDPPALPLEASPVVGSGWDALSFGSGSLTPPDVQVAVGPSHILEAVNVNLGVYSKQGTSITSYSLSTLFGTGSDFISDPRIIYDRGTSRWFLTVVDVSTGQVVIAVSKTPDPLGVWSPYRVPAAATSTCPDQPILGVGTLNIIVSVNMFSSCRSANFTYDGAQFWVVNKTNLIDGSASPSVWTSALYAEGVSIHPARMETPSPVQYLVSTLWNFATNTSSTLQVFSVIGSPPGDVHVTVTESPIVLADMPPSARQPDPNYVLDRGDFRVQDAVWSRGILWLGFNEACPGGLQIGCVRLIQLDTNPNLIRQDFRLSSASRNYFYPALALDAAGDLAILVGYSSADEYPGLLVTGRLSRDPAGVLQTPVTVRAGVGLDRSWCHPLTAVCRYGDYFGASIDPSDPGRVWFAGEFGRGLGVGWGTFVLPVQIKAMLTLSYSLDSTPVPAEGPRLHFVRDGTTSSVAIGTRPTTFLIDPGTAWHVDSNFTTPSSDTLYLARTPEDASQRGVANRSASASLAYLTQYRVTIHAGPDGLVSYALSGTGRTLQPNTNETFFVARGTVVNLTAQPSSLFYVFSGWTGDLAGTGASGSLTVDQPRSVAARFSLNWGFIAALTTIVGIAAVASLVFLLRRRRGASPPREMAPPPPPPPAGPSP